MGLPEAPPPLDAGDGYHFKLAREWLTLASEEGLSL